MIDAGSVYSDLILNIDKYEQNMKKAEKQMDTFAGNLQKAGDRAAEIGQSWSLRVTAPIAALGTAAVATGMKFQAGMSEVQAISGATGESLARLEEKAKFMGATTKFSATEAAEGLKYMAMAGWDTNQMLDGLEGVMMLAAASGENLAMVSDIVTDALTAFSMQASQAGELADLLASAASNSNTNVAMLGESFKYVAPIFGSLNYSAEDAALALGLMANAGIKASQAGTTLRGAITHLVKPVGEAADVIEELGVQTTDAEGNMLPFYDVMVQLRGAFGKLTDEQRAQYAATIFGQQAMSGMLAIINATPEDFAKLTEATRDYTGAAKDMAETMQDNLQGQITILKSGLEGLALKAFDVLMPYVTDLVAKLQSMVDWFDNLSPAMQKGIVQMVGLAAAAGPVLLIGGKMASGLGSIIGLFGKFSGAAGAATAAATATASGIGAAGAAAKAGALLMNPWVLGIGAATAAGIGLYKHLEQESIPSIQMFGETVSETTREAIGAFVTMHDDVQVTLDQLSWSGQAVTAEMAEGIVDNYLKMTEQVQAGLDKHYKESVLQMETFFTASESITREEQAQILADMQQHHEDQKNSVAEKEARIQEIMQRASVEKRALTKEEQQEINQIQREMKEQAVRALSENEIEARAILERMKNQAGEITALQAAEVVRNSLEQKDKTIEAAEEQYDAVTREIIKQRDVVGSISEEQAQKLMAEAKKQYEEVKARAEEMHEAVVTEAKAQATEHVNQVDWETGQVKSKWESLVDSTKSAFSRIGSAISGAISKLREWASAARSAPAPSIRIPSTMSVAENALGTSYFPGGLSWVGEQGPELVELPRGTKVYSNQQSMQMTKPIEQKTEYHFHFGTVIADDYGLKQLERRLREFRIEEEARLGVEF